MLIAWQQKAALLKILVSCHNLTTFSSSEESVSNITKHLDRLADMAPTFDTLSDHDFDDVDEEEIDFSGMISVSLVPVFCRPF